MTTGLIAILALALLDVITILILRHESNKRKDAEKKALEAAHNVDVLTQAQKIKQEARNETDKKIETVRSSSSDRDKFNHIMDELSKLNPNNPFAN